MIPYVDIFTVVPCSDILLALSDCSASAVSRSVVVVAPLAAHRSGGA